VAGPSAIFDLRGVAVPTSAFEQGGFLVITAQARGDIPDLTIDFMGVVEAAGYDVAGSDDEGFEAEVFFAAGQVAAGQVVLTESDCPDVVDVRITLLDDAAARPRDTAARRTDATATATGTAEPGGTGMLPDDDPSGAPPVTTATS